MGHIRRYIAEVFDQAGVDEGLPAGDGLELPKHFDELLGDRGGIRGRHGHRMASSRRCCCCRRRKCRRFDSSAFHRVLGAGKQQDGIVRTVKKILSQTDDQTIQNALLVFRSERGGGGGG